MATIVTTQMMGKEREGTTGMAGAQVRHVMSRAPQYVFYFFFYLFFIY